MYIYIIYVHMYTCMYVCMYVCMCLYVYIYIYYIYITGLPAISEHKTDGWRQSGSHGRTIPSIRNRGVGGHNSNDY